MENFQRRCDTLLYLFSPEEVKRFAAVFSQAGAADDHGRLPGRLCFNALIRSQLPQATLKKIWDTVCTKPGSLSRGEFYCALRLIAVAQTDKPVSKESLLQHTSVRLPRFGSDAPLDTIHHKSNHDHPDRKSAGRANTQHSSPHTRPTPRQHTHTQPQSQPQPGANSTPSTPHPPTASTPYMWSVAEYQFFRSFFPPFPVHHKPAAPILLTPAQAVPLLAFSGLTREQIRQAYLLADLDKDGLLGEHEFCIAIKLCRDAKKFMAPFPDVLPPVLLKVPSPDDEAMHQEPHHDHDTHHQEEEEEVVEKEVVQEERATPVPVVADPFASLLPVTIQSETPPPSLSPGPSASIRSEPTSAAGSPPPSVQHNSNNSATLQEHEVWKVVHAYADFWKHVKFRLGSRPPPKFTYEQCKELLLLAARCVVRVRAELDASQSGMKLRMVDGSAREFMWKVYEERWHPSERPHEFVHGLVKSTFRDAHGFVEGVTAAYLEQRLRKTHLPAPGTPHLVSTPRQEVNDANSEALVVY